MSYVNDEMNESTFLADAHCKSVWLWKPKRCRLSNKWLWLEHAVCATQMHIAPTTVVIEHRYYSTKQFIMAKLRIGF